MMQRVGYDFPTFENNGLTRPAHEPDWAKTLTTSTQGVMDGQYKRALDNLFGQGDGFLQTQTIKRQNSADPAHYQPDQFPIAVPRRQMVDYDPDGNLAPFWADADSRIKLPVLDPWTPPATGGNPGFTHAGGAAAAAQDTELAQILKLVTAIAARMGITA